MSNIKFLRNLLVCFLFITLVNNSFGGICNLCTCTQSETTKTVNCEGKREIDNYTEIFDLLAFDDYNSVGKLILSRHEITSLPLDAFRGLSHMKSLDLSENSIEKFEADIFRDLKSLEELDFSFNVLGALSGATFNHLQTLLKLNLSNNQIGDFNDTTADQLPKLTHLDLSHNNLKTIDSDFVKSLSSLEFLDVSFNEIATFSGETLLKLSSLSHLRATNNLFKNIWGEYLPESLRTLSIGHNLISSLPLNLSQVRNLNIEDNAIASMDGETEWLRKLKTLNISGNLLTTLPDVQFGELGLLDVSQNDLSVIPATLTASNFPVLETLDISGNPIKDLVFDRELRLRRLRARNLFLLDMIQDNAFRNLKGVDDSCINLTVSHSPRLWLIKKGAFNNVTLCSLDLSNNNLTQIPREAIVPQGTILARSGVDLQGNPLKCECGLQWILNDLVPHLYNVQPKFLDNLRCASPIELAGTRMVHWFKWKTQVLCDTTPKELSKMIDTAAVLSAGAGGDQVTLDASRGMLAIVAAAMATLCILIIVGIMIGRRVAIRRRRMNRRF